MQARCFHRGLQLNPADRMMQQGYWDAMNLLSQSRATADSFGGGLPEGDAPIDPLDAPLVDSPRLNMVPLDAAVLDDVRRDGGLPYGSQAGGAVVDNFDDEPHLGDAAARQSYVSEGLLSGAGVGLLSGAGEGLPGAAERAPESPQACVPVAADAAPETSAEGKQDDDGQADVAVELAVGSPSASAAAGSTADDATGP